MSRDNAEQVLLQVHDLLRRSPLSASEASVLAFQLLVWAHLSAQRRLEPETTVDTALVHGAAGVADVLRRLALIDGPVGLAFGDGARRAQLSGDYIVQAAMAARRLAEGGIFERFSPADVAAALLHGSTEVVSVPVEVAELMVSLIAREGVRSVYCPWESSGRFVGALLDHDVRLYVETPYSTPVLALLSLLRNSETQIVLNDPLRSPSAIVGGHLERFDAAVSILPWGPQTRDDIVMADLYGRFPVSRATGMGLNIQHIVAQTQGTVAIVAPNSFLFGPGRDREVREYLLSKGWVRAAIALPAGLLGGKNLASTLLLLDTCANADSIAFVDATQEFFCSVPPKGRVTLANTDAILKFCNGPSDSQSVGEALDETRAIRIRVSEIAANDASLQVDRYVIASEQRAMQAKLSVMETEALDEIVDVLSPPPHRDRGVDSPTAIEVYEVGAADLPTAGYIRTPERSIQLQFSPRRSGGAEDVFLRPYDLVLITKGSVGKIGIVPANVPPPGAGGWVAGQSAVVLRSKSPGIDLRGLGLWLRSKLGQQLLDSIKSGASIPMVSIATLRRLKVIALIPAWTQLAIEVLEEEDDLQYQIEALQDQQASIAEKLWNELLK